MSLKERIDRILADPASHDALLAAYGIKSLIEGAISQRILDNKDSLRGKASGYGPDGFWKKEVKLIIVPWQNDGFKFSFEGQKWDDNLTLLHGDVKLASKSHGRYISVTKNGVF